MNGHNHAGAYDLQQGVHFLTLAGMVETPDQNAFAIVELRQGQLDLQGFGRIDDILLDLK
jgi:hypothetical protein